MIPIIDNFYMTADDEQWVLKEKVMQTYQKDTKEHKKGEQYEVYKIHGYFPKISRLFKDVKETLIRRKVQDGKIKTLDSLIKEFKELEKYLKEIMLEFEKAS